MHFTAPARPADYDETWTFTDSLSTTLNRVLNLFQPRHRLRVSSLLTVAFSWRRTGGWLPALAAGVSRL